MLDVLSAQGDGSQVVGPDPKCDACGKRMPLKKLLAGPGALEVLGGCLLLIVSIIGFISLAVWLGDNP
jgi:hypothetical protein